MAKSAFKQKVEGAAAAPLSPTTVLKFSPHFKRLFTLLLATPQFPCVTVLAQGLKLLLRPSEATEIKTS